jgi:hypothetical protein
MLLQRLDRLLVRGGGEMIVVGTVAALHAAIRDLSLQRGIGVERRDEFRDIAVPGVLRRILPAILDEKTLHARSSLQPFPPPPGAPWRQPAGLASTFPLVTWAENKRKCKYGQK